MTQPKLELRLVLGPDGRVGSLILSRAALDDVVGYVSRVIDAFDWRPAPFEWSAEGFQERVAPGGVARRP